MAGIITFIHLIIEHLHLKVLFLWRIVATEQTDRG